MAINILDSFIINRISAGEVVESPFSIVKELMDNSLDANATKITVEIKNGGIDQIIVKDNGKGIDKEDMIKAFMPHATSKIKDVDDLSSIATLGFRGEALASISNVSQTSLLTKTKNVDTAYYLEINGGKFGEITASSSENGTKIEVNNLFFNTPARRKFLKKPKQEENQITNIVSRYILAHPTIQFKYIVDGKTIFNKSGTDLLSAIETVYDVETTQNIVYVEKQVGNIKLFGYVSKVGYSKPNTTYQTLIINGRYVIDEIVSKAVYMAFEEYLMTRQFPFYVLNIEMPNVDVDVNVHPSKLNVKFASPSKIYDVVYTAVKEAVFRQINPTVATVNNYNYTKPEENLIKTDINSLKEISIDPNPITPNINKTIELRQTSFSPITMFDLKKELEPLKADDAPKDEPKQNELVSVNNFLDYKIVGELFNEFLILEKDETMILLDFHAGHERLNYDKFTNMVKNRAVVQQDLLIPYTQQLSKIEIDFIMNLKPQLNELGFDIGEFGDNKIIINTVPMQLKDIDLKAFVDDLLHDLKNFKPTLNNEIRHYLMQKACKSSVKSGMKLSNMEINELLKDLDLKNPVLLCPHGRPVITVLPKSQIEKWFRRIV